MDSDSLDNFRPKRFLSAYNFFFKHEREEFLKSQAAASPPIQPKCPKQKRRRGNPDFGSLSKRIAEKWKHLSPEERKVYEDMASKDLARYHREINAHKRKMAEERKKMEQILEEFSCTKQSEPAKQQQVAKSEVKSQTSNQPAETNRSLSMKRNFSEIKELSDSVVCRDADKVPSVDPDKIMPYLTRPPSLPDEVASSTHAEGDCTRRVEGINSITFGKNEGNLAMDSTYFPTMFIDHSSMRNMTRKRKMSPSNFQANKLYGRSKHIASIMDAFMAVRQGKSAFEIVFLSGCSGAGKSTLVQKVQEPITDMGGNFLCGKFDYFRQMEPLSAIILAFSQYCTEIVTRDAEKLHQTRIAIQEKVGSAVTFLANVIPSVCQIIQLPPIKTVDVGGMEAMHMIKYVFKQFVKAIATPEHPLVLFLDDLQWADPLSLDLIESLATDSENKSLLFIGSYRDNEITEMHPLTSKLSGIKRKHVKITKIEVCNLSVQDTNLMISDLIQTPPHRTETLSNAVYRKTSGNVFNILQFLNSIHDDGILFFSSESKQWQWNAAMIDSINYADNSVELMSHKILHLPKQTQNALKLMSCLGFCCEEFVLSAMATGEDIRNFGCVDLISSLDLAKKDGLIERALGSNYKFAHDQIQLAAYSLIPHEERGNWHLWIGTRVLEHKSVSPEKALFIAVGQLNKGAFLMKEINQRFQLIMLNLQAAEKSKSLGAFVPAAFYLNMGINLLGKLPWTDHYDLCVQLYSSCAEAEHCIGAFDEMNHKLQEIFNNARCLDDELVASFTFVSALLAQHEFQKALEVGLLVLSHLGESFPVFSDIQSITMVEFAKAKQMIEGKSDDDLFAIKNMDDDHKIAAMRMMYILGHASFVACSDVFPLIVLRMVQTSLNHGICDESAFGFGCFSLIMCTIFKDISGACRFGQLSLRLLDKTQEKKCLPGVYAVVYTFIQPWLDHYRASLGPLEYAYNTGMRCGDVSFAMTAAVQYCFHAFHCGAELERVNKIMTKYVEKMVELKQEPFSTILLPYRQAILNLMGDSENPEQLTGKVMDQDQLLSCVLRAKNVRVIAVIYHLSCWLAYIFGKYELASTLMEKRQAVSLVCCPPFLSCAFLFVEGLIALAIAQQSGETKWKAFALKSIDGMKEYALHAPVNYQHKLLLLQAESASLTGEYDNAAKFYDEAIKTAGENGFVQDQALACERAGIYYSEQGNVSLGSRYYIQSHSAYLKWGAKCKATHLCLRYGISANLIHSYPSDKL